MSIPLINSGSGADTMADVFSKINQTIDHSNNYIYIVSGSEAGQNANGTYIIIGGSTTIPNTTNASCSALIVEATFQTTVEPGVAPNIIQINPKVFYSLNGLTPSSLELDNSNRDLYYENYSDTDKIALSWRMFKYITPGSSDLKLKAEVVLSNILSSGIGQSDVHIIIHKLP